MNRLRILQDVIDRHLTTCLASRRLEISNRHCRSLLERYREHGPKYWQQPKKLGATRVVLLSLVRQSYRESDDPAGAGNFAAMVATKGIKVSRWRADNKADEIIDLISSLLPGH